MILHIQDEKLLVGKRGQIIAHVLVEPNPLHSQTKYFGTKQFRKRNKTKNNEFIITIDTLKNKNTQQCLTI